MTPRFGKTALASAAPVTLLESRSAGFKSMASARSSLLSVEKVTTSNVKGKTKRTARGVSRSKNWKKAYVRVAAGQEIDFMVTD